MEKKKELLPIYEDVKSYYKKAFIVRYYDENGLVEKTELISYRTSILYIKNSEIYFNFKDINNNRIYSHTTLRHIKEFIKQHYYMLELNYKDIIAKEKLTKKDIEKLIELGN